MRPRRTGLRLLAALALTAVLATLVAAQDEGVTPGASGTSAEEVEEPAGPTTLAAEEIARFAEEDLLAESDAPERRGQNP